MSATNTRVVNVKTEYIRPQGYDTLREWMKDPKNVYIGRKCIVLLPTEADPSKKARYPSHDSKFANPFKIPKEVSKIQKHDSATYKDIVLKIITEYESYLRERIRVGTITKDDIESLRGKNLGCWCKIPGKEVPCHGDVLLKILNEC